jgi:hypothetical protein
LNAGRRFVFARIDHPQPKEITMPTLLPRDVDNAPIPAIRLKADGAHQIIITDESTRNATAFNADTRIISLYATVPAYIAFGDATVEASDEDHYFPAGIYYDVAIGGGKVAHTTHIAALQLDEGGILYISEKE